MTIKTTPALTVTAAEAARVDAEVATLTDSVTKLTASNAALALRVSQLEAQLPPPGPTGATGVTGPTGGTGPAPRNGLYVDGGTLRSKTGATVLVRGIELLWGPTASSSPGTVCTLIRSFGANAIGPLFQNGSPSSAASVSACIASASTAGLVVGVNADDPSNGRAWICRPEIVSLCNAANNVFLQCEVEQGEDTSVAQWRDRAIAFVQALRTAGHRAPIKVGSPLGGRLPHFALQGGAAVRDADPQRNVLFTWQAYWKTVTTGWQFANESGFPSGTAGALACADAIKASGLCFIVGLDGADDVGPTPYAELAARLHQHGIGWQWWAWMVGDRYGNGLVSDTLSSTPKAPFGATVQALLRQQATAALLQ